MTTGFFHDERTLWHFGAVHTGNLPAGGWVQPSNGGFMAEAPDPKRRIVSLLEVSGVAASLDRRSAEPAPEEALRRVHTRDYLDRFAQLSAAAAAPSGRMPVSARAAMTMRGFPPDWRSPRSRRC